MYEKIFINIHKKINANMRYEMSFHIYKIGKKSKNLTCTFVCQSEEEETFLIVPVGLSYGTTSMGGNLAITLKIKLNCSMIQGFHF